MKDREIAAELAALSPERRAQLLRRFGEPKRAPTTISHRPPQIARAPRGKSLPASFAQEDHWLFEQVAGTAPILFGIRFTGALDLTALQKSLTDIAARHDILRTTFALVGGTVTQVVGSPRALDIPIVDLGDLPAAARDEQLQKLFVDHARKPQDLRHGPLLGTTLVRLGDQEHCLIITAHHAVFDAWSETIFCRELVQLYDAHHAGAPLQLPALPIQYADYATWQRAALHGAELERQLVYWKTRLAHAPTLELPTDRPRPPRAANEGAAVRFNFGKDLLDGLKELGRAERATLFTVIFAGLNIVLSRYSGQQDIVVGTTVATRRAAETEALIGPFINGVVLRTNLAGHPSVRELIGRIRKDALDAYEYQEVPLAQIVRELRIVRDPSRTPVFQVTFVFMNMPRSWAASSSGLSLERVPLESGRGLAPYDITLWVGETEVGQELGGHLEYSTA
ncbi:MAG: condensation domain-containing protein, partial [Polyangiaceae bacterium]